MKFLKSSALVVFLLLLVSMYTNAQPCIKKLRALKENLTNLVLTNYDFVPGRDCSDFVSLQAKTENKIDSLISCHEIDVLKADLSKLKNSLQAIRFNGTLSKVDATEPDYYKFASARESFARSLLQFEVDKVVKALKDSIDTLMKRTKDSIYLQLHNLDRAVKDVSNIKTTINEYTWNTVDTLADTVKAYHKELLNDLQGHKEILKELQRKENGSPIYAGINWFTQDALGFGMHYHLRRDTLFSPLAGLMLLYQWRPPAHDQDTVHHDFGIAVSGGFSFPLSPHNRLGLMLDVAMINDEVKAGGRLMAYNRNFAVGMGYNEYLGADITLMIRFHDSK